MANLPASASAPLLQAAQGQRLRIGLYGGAFDPPHNAHVALAATAVQALSLDLLYVVPTGQPWMKQRRLTDATDRLAMARLAFASVPQAQVDDCEIRRSGTTYTIDTLRELQQRLAAQGMPAAAADWFLLMGQDLLLTLPRWQRADELLHAVTVAVLQRPDAASAPVAVDTVDTAIVTVRQALPQLRTFQLHLPPSSIRSTQIRQGWQQRQPQSHVQRMAWLQTLVPQGVAQYIDQHQLYLTRDGH